MGRKNCKGLTPEPNRSEVTQTWDEAITFTNRLEAHSLIHDDLLYESFLNVMELYHQGFIADSSTVHEIVRDFFECYPEFLRDYNRCCANRQFSPTVPINPNEVGTCNRKREIDNDEDPKQSEENKRRKEEASPIATVSLTVSESCPPSYHLPGKDCGTSKAPQKKTANVAEKKVLMGEDIRENVKWRPETCAPSYHVPSEDCGTSKEPQQKKIPANIVKKKVPREEDIEEEDVIWRPGFCTPTYRYLQQACVDPSYDDSDPRSVLNNTCGIFIPEDRFRRRGRTRTRSKQERELDELEDELFERDMELPTNKLKRHKMKESRKD